LYSQELDSNYTPQGGPRRITRQNLLGPFRGVTWIGKSLVYSGQLCWGMLYLWRVKADGVSEPERLEMAGVAAMFPAFSPVENRLAFMRSNANSDIWRYKADGSHEPFITSSLYDDSAQFSPDGQRIAFSSTRSGEAYDIWVANADGSHPIQLTNRIGRSQGSPRWSPDGRWIAFDSARPDGKQDIYIIDATGGRPRRLDLGPYQNALPSWSRDSVWIYYMSDRTGRHEIWRVHPAGGRPEQVTDNGGHNCSESADGKTLFYAKADRGTPLFARSLSGGPERKVIEYNGSAREFPVFEDGFYYSGRAENGKVPLLFFQFSTGSSRLITHIEQFVFFGLTVSPDRRTILYTRSVSVGADLMLIENFR
jgi:dipeptidyl aminopeptidase/acylaminoacyl peptidase